jgi:GPH family glycoside/pentoside/hexuronide:cation symporter
MENSTSNIQTPPKFSTKQRIYWGLASFGGSIISGIYASLLPIFLTDYLGMVEYAELIYIMSIVYAIWNALNDPLFGIISDRSKLKKGRRIPYMRYTAPFLAIFFILVWFAPAESGPIAIFWWMLIVTLLYDTAYTIIFLVFSALLPEVTENEIERNYLQVFGSFFSLLGMILGFIIPEIFRHQTDFLPLQMAMIGVGLVGMAFIMFTTYKFSERPEFTKIDEPLGFIDSIKYTFRNKSFLTLVSANFMSILIQAMLLGSLFYLADYITQSSTLILIVFLFLPLILGIWITPKLSKRFGVVRADQILLTIAGIGLILLTFMPIIGIYLCLALAGFGLTGPLVLTTVMWGEVADEDELRTGVRREGVFFGMNAFITKPAQSLALVIPVALLAWANFIPRTGTQPNLNQPPEVFLAIRLFIGLIPGTALLIEVLILQIYPLRGEYLKEVQEKVLKVHAEKHSKLEDMEKKRTPDVRQQ